MKTPNYDLYNASTGDDDPTLHDRLALFEVDELTPPFGMATTLSDEALEQALDSDPFDKEIDFSEFDEQVSSQPVQRRHLKLPGS